VKLAIVPLNRTAVAPMKFAPLIVTLAPTGPLAGVTLAIVGGLMTVKLLALLAAPAEVVTLIGPLGASAGTVAVIAVAEPTVKLALVPLNRTALASVKFVPLIVTLVSTRPLVGVKLAIVGGLETVTVTGSDVHVVRLPRARATAVRVWEPLLAVVVFQETEYGAEASSAPRSLPSSLNWTPSTMREPTTLTLALTGTVPRTGESGGVTVTIRLLPGSGGSNCARAGCGAIRLQPTSADRAVA